MSIIGSRQFDRNAPGNDYIRDDDLDDTDLYNPYDSYVESLKSEEEKLAFQRDAAQYLGQIKTSSPGSIASTLAINAAGEGARRLHNRHNRKKRAKSKTADDKTTRGSDAFSGALIGAGVSGVAAGAKDLRGGWNTGARPPGIRAGIRHAFRHGRGPHPAFLPIGLLAGAGAGALAHNLRPEDQKISREEMKKLWMQQMDKDLDEVDRETEELSKSKQAGEVSEMFDHESRKLTAKEQFIRSRQGSSTRPQNVPGPRKASMPKTAEDIGNRVEDTLKKYLDLRTTLTSGPKVEQNPSDKPSPGPIADTPIPDPPKPPKNDQPTRKFKAAAQLPPQIGQAARRAFGWASEMKDPGVATAVGMGALGLGGGTYLASRPKEELDGKSKAETELEHAVNASKAKDKSKAKLPERVGDRTREFSHGLSQEFRQSPVAAGLLGAGVGASLGLGLARTLGIGK